MEGKLVFHLIAIVIMTGYVCSTHQGHKRTLTSLAAEKRVTVCSKRKSPLTCESPGSAIAITGVFWGRESPNICPSDDGDPVTNCHTAPETEHIVKEMCEGMGSCVLEGKADKLQKTKHCFGVSKYLSVNYTCVPQNKEAILCDSERSMISCPSDWLLRINTAFWGRDRTEVCPSAKGQELCPGASETVSKLRSRCNNIPFCPLQAFYRELENGGENCPHIEKYLVVNYSCRPSPEIGRRGQLGLIPLSVYRGLRSRSLIWKPSPMIGRNKFRKKSFRKKKLHL